MSYRIIESSLYKLRSGVWNSPFLALCMSDQLVRQYVSGEPCIPSDEGVPSRY